LPAQRYVRAPRSKACDSALRLSQSRSQTHAQGYAWLGAVAVGLAAWGGAKLLTPERSKADEGKASKAA